MSGYSFIETEQKFQKKWEKDQIYSFDPSSDRKTFVIDTPPPTVSGSLHIGHAFSYIQTDIIARFQRMRGKNVFYPMGWDDNGLPTERRTQNLYAVKYDPKKSFDPSFQAEKAKPSQKRGRAEFRPISRENFIQLVRAQLKEDESEYKKFMQRLGLSVDWRLNWRTIEPLAQSLAQLSFLDLYKKGFVENRLSPVLWDTQFQTAVAQADTEDRPRQGFYWRITFKTADQRDEFAIATTRPEMLPACVAIAAHPEDDRYKKLLGRKALTPLFERQVPILPSTHADPEKGTGILMICTYGDMEDASFCQKHNLPVLSLIDEEGFLKGLLFDKEPFKSERPDQAQAFYSRLKALRAGQARLKIVDLLKEKKLLRGEPVSALQHIKFYEKGDFPLEILPKRQWYIKTLERRGELLRQGRKIKWHPPEMRKRYEQWVEALNQDWCISRQRPYGVPFPVWHLNDGLGQADYSRAVVPDKREFYHEKDLGRFMILGGYSPTEGKDYMEYITAPGGRLALPIDPFKQCPKGMSEGQRNRPGGFSADANVMDTWNVSSLTPYINSGWILNAERHEKLFPADLRPQSHEIIRTWAFYSIAKAWFHEKAIPWRSVVISGWALNPQRKKMSKSKGKTFKPDQIIKEYGVDSLRYWSGKARLGRDTVIDENSLKTGRRLVTKIFNAGRFVLSQAGDEPFNEERVLRRVATPLDRAWLAGLLEEKIQALKSLEDYRHALALEIIEKSFWSFCDNYLEMAKARAYQMKDRPEGISARSSLDYSLYLFLKLFAPYLPHITEELWQKRYVKESLSAQKSLYREERALQKIREELCNGGPSSFKPKSLLERAFLLLAQIRKAKTASGKSQAVALKSLQITAEPKFLREFALYREDMAKTVRVPVEAIALVEGDEKPEPSVQLVFEKDLAQDPKAAGDKSSGESLTR